MDDTRNQTAGAPTTPGMFQTTDGAVYRVVKSQAGRLYAKRLNERGGFDYAGGAIKRLTEDDRMTLAMAAAWGRRFGVCAYCGRDLTDPASIAAGIGPVCAKGEDGRWSAEEREAAKVALDWDAEQERMKAERAEAVAANVQAEPEPEVEPEPAGMLTVEDDKATLVSAYDPEAVEAARVIPGRRWDAARKVNTFPVNDLTAGALVALVERFGYTLVGTLPDPAAIEAKRDENEAASRAIDADVDLVLGGDLLPFQKAGVAYALVNGSVLIGDDMGLGKTVQALAALEAKGAYPALVIAPATVKAVWRRHVETWLPGRTVAVVSGRGNGAAAPVADVTIINYDLVESWLPRLKEASYAAVIADESHYLKNSKAKRTKAVRALAKVAPFRLLLTGTPVLNRPVELIAQLDVLGRLEEFGGFWGFAKRYCDARHNGYGWDLGGASNLEELHDRLRQTCMIRRTKDQVLTELPAKRRATVPMEVSDRKAYDRVLADLRSFIAEKVAADVAVVEGTEEAEVEKRLRAARQAEVLTRINALRQMTARVKMDAVEAWVADFLTSGRKLVLFAHHHEVVDRLAETFGADKIRGGETTEAREAAVARFQNDPEAQVLVCSIGAGGVGITLTAASDVAFVELPWRPGDLDQAEDRCHRIGQHDSVTAWYLLAEDTMDETMGALLDEKRGVVTATIDGKAAPAGSSILSGLLDALLGEEAMA